MTNLRSAAESDGNLNLTIKFQWFVTKFDCQNLSDDWTDYKSPGIRNFLKWRSSPAKTRTEYPTNQTGIEAEECHRTFLGHLKNYGLFGRNYLKCELGDGPKAILCGGGRNIRLILEHLMFFFAFILAGFVAILARPTRRSNFMGGLTAGGFLNY